MFTNLHIQNFKSWADTGEFRMAPLTGFFGTNSSGKTAILQFILMLKQTVESSDRNTILHLGGDRYSYVDLGTTYDIVHNHKFPAQIEYSLTWKPKNISQRSLKLPTGVHKSQAPLPGVFALISTSDNYVWKAYSSLLKFRSVFNINIDEVKLKFSKYSFQMLNQKWSHLERKLPILNADIRGNLFITGEIVQNFSSFLNGNDRSFEFKLHDNLKLAFEDLFINSYYLAPLRAYPERTYLWSGESPQDVGKYGELTVAALLASRKTDPDIETAVAKALQDLGLIHSFKLQAIAENRRDYEILVQRSANSPEVLITDVGFGVSQILPVLVLCYYVPKGSTVILEQPEIHLHPSVQAKLADVFIDAIKTRNIQIIIESHSEHLLRRLQRRVAEAKDGFTNEDAALYFCDMTDDGTSQLVPLELDTFGNINNYPQDFFGDEMGDLVAMTEATMQRQMNS
jgi:predicted ATPase